ncbi:MAG: SH3 domain-containing protein [Clostridia bacterium]|nr:SH3 domain-containing protein [Clostridia bacterium]
MKRFLMMVLVVIFVSNIGAMAEWLYATDGDTYVHTEADIESDTFGVFKKGEKVWVYDHTYTPDGRNWCEVQFLGRTGFISDRYSSYLVSNPDDYDDVNHSSQELEQELFYEYDGEEGDEFEGHGFEYEAEFEFIANRNVKVRAWAGNDGNVIGTLKRNTTVWGSIIYVVDDQAWLEVMWGNDQYGYIPTDSLNLTESLVDNTYPRFSRRMKVTGGRVNVREDADIMSQDIATLQQGDEVLVDFFICVDDGERRIWADVVTEDGQVVGFVSTRYLIPVR